MRGLVRSGAAIIVLLVGTLVIGTMVIVASFNDPQGVRVQRLTRAWARLMLRSCGARLEVEGLERLDAERSYVFASNHRSMLDIPALMGTLPNRFGFLAKQDLFRIPIFGRILVASSCIPVNRTEGRKAASSLREAARLLEAGRSVCVFPEGTRSRTDKLLPFKSGAFLVAVHSHAPVVPVTLVGTGEVLPPGSWWVRPGPVRVVIGEPMEVAGRRRDELARLTMERVAENLGEGGTTPTEFRQGK